MVNVAGFENTVAVSQKLKGMLQQFGNEILNNPDQFISLMNDYIPEYEKERRLLKNVTKSGILTAMQRGDNHKISIMKSKEYMMNEMFLSEGAVEFVMVCFTYLLDWSYETTMPEQGAMPAPAQTFSAQPQFANPFAPPPPVNTYGTPQQAMRQPMMAQPAMVQPMPQSALTPQQPQVTPVPQRQPVQPVVEEIPQETDPDKIFKPSDAGRYRLKGNVKIPSGYTTLDSFCFDGFGFMKNAELPSTLITIGDYAFSECKRLKTITIPASVRILGAGVFNLCGKLTKVNIPAGVTEIPDNIFQFCHNLEIVDLPNTIVSIGSCAFQGCDSLKKLFIPDSVKQIADDAFSQCRALTIKCYDKSYVQRYCREVGIKTETISKGGLY